MMKITNGKEDNMGMFPSNPDTALSRWGCGALAGGVAFAAMVAGAQADELSALKAQIEALQSRVNQVEAAGPTASNARSEGVSYISFRRGSDIAMSGRSGRAGDDSPSDRGFTMAITPTADVPAPVMEVSVGGFVKGDLIYDTRNNLGRAAGAKGVAIDGGDDENFQAHARQSRFNIRSRSDTAVGQIRTLVEGDFWNDTGFFRLRHAWGEWDLMPDLTLGVGQSWSTHYHFAGEIPTVDFDGMTGTAGYNQSRSTQIQLKSASGPFSWAVGLQDPSRQVENESNQLPDLAAKVNLDLAGTSVGIGAIVQELHVDSDGGSAHNDSAIGYGVGIGVDLPLGELFVLHGHINYGDGSKAMTGSAANPAYVDDGKIRTRSSLGLGVGATMRLSEASSINAAWSYSDTSTKGLNETDDETHQKVHANYMWQPVSKLRMGFEGIWSQRERVNNDDQDNLRFQLGTWFFF